MRTLFVMHKQEVARLGVRVAEYEGRCGGGVYTNQHPPPLSHVNEALGISRTLLLPQVSGARKRLAAAGQMDLILLNANDISPFSSLAPCHY